MEEKKKIILYTDGACSGNPGPGGWGLVLRFGEKEKELSGFDAQTTNNRMELMAVITGLETLKEACNVTIYTDSKYVSDAINKGWLKNWKKNGYKKSDKKPILNLDLWIRVEAQLERHNTQFIWVKGHAENKYNNRCDELATGAIKSHA